ncbi:unnamed protein product [Rotaria sordida]|uniref:Uncharacterized protein n=1 Tax=Rotaria sordida TaxID=392033 RepID=A0A814VI78_9BILA|nr:unnamed protein product [Rotaria sordida]CAF1159995.1 unnamed protein product [Rotaria sordida]CAF1185771.1 unnamed protein product [Rotaria sordida]CAF1245844.1 unnamed protein product [Rotaria sordida]CAF1407462.1 unnamed protein product [Rotaria sordida]
MISTTFYHFKLIIGLVLLCALIQISDTRPTLIDDEQGPSQVDHSFINNYGDINERLHDEIPLEDFYNLKNLFDYDNVQMAKRLIMLPRVGRRSIRST